MSIRTRLLRLLAGLGLLLALLAGSFAAVIPAIHRWGATDEEVALALPGDELLPAPLVLWTNAVTINAPPDQVWPWIAQLGDTHAGFYSYTWIENRVGALTGAADYQVIYRNAGQIMPAWQRRAPGDPLIQGVLNVRTVEPGAWLLAATPQSDAFGWTWLWRVYPLDGGAKSRLVIRNRIQAPPEMSNPATTFMLDAGGFVMEQRMMRGIKLRAEGGSEPAWMEAAEIALWLAALSCGLAAAGLFVFRQAWLRPLTVAVAAVLGLFILTFVQPPLWTRAILDTLLVCSVWWAYQSNRPHRQATPRVQAASPT
jgi:hypothetical protein